MHVANIKIDHNKVDADLTDYIIYVDLSDMNATFWSTVADGGGDIRVYKADGTTELAREVVSCDTTEETGELHIKYSGTLSSSTDTVIQIHADGSSADYAVTGTYGRNNVWSDYGAVYHLLQTSGTAVDSTGNSNSGTFNGDLPDVRDSKIGKGQDLDGAGDTVSIANNATINPQGTDETTISAWIKPGTQNKDYVGIIRKNGVYAFYYTRTNNSLHFWNNAGSSETPKVTGANNSITEGSWNYVVARYDGTNITVIANGTSIANQSKTGNIANDTAVAYIGSGSGSGTSEYFTGGIDELRINLSALSDSRIATEYNNQNSPSTFYSVNNVTSFIPKVIIY